MLMDSTCYQRGKFFFRFVKGSHFAGLFTERNVVRIKGSPWPTLIYRGFMSEKVVPADRVVLNVEVRLLPLNFFP